MFIIKNITDNTYYKQDEQSIIFTACYNDAHRFYIKQWAEEEILWMGNSGQYEIEDTGEGIKVRSST